MSSENLDESSSSQPEAMEEDNSIKDTESKVAAEFSMTSEIKGNETDGSKNSVDSDNGEAKKDDADKAENKILSEDSENEEMAHESDGEKTGNVKNGKNKKADDKESAGESDKEDSEKEDNEKSDSEKDSDDESDSKKQGLLDRPPEVSGCRARKKVQRLEVSFSTTKEKVEIPEGRGQKLGDCPRIEFQIAKHPVAELKILHRILFTRPGNVHETKKNIRKFSGFPFQKNAGEFAQKKGSIEKFKTADLKKVCEVLDLERGKSKEDMVSRILEFLLQPTDSGKALPKKKSTGRAKKKSVEKKVKSSKKKTKGKSVDDDEANNDDDEEEEEEEEEENDDEMVPSASEGSNNSAGEEEDEESDKESKKTKSTPKGKKTPAKTKVTKKEKPKRESVKGTKRKRDVPSGSSDDDDDEPVAKKSKMPSDDDIKKLVKKILDKADLEEITMKKVIKQVFDTYPDCDLAHKKAFIKATIKSVIA